MALRFTLLFILSWSALAQDCTPVNLLTEANSPFEKIPVYDQGQLNICYAYSAAQILDWYQMKKGAGKRSVHPAWVALQYALARHRNKLEIGHPKEAMESVRDSLNCDFDSVEAALAGRRIANDVFALRSALEKPCSPEKRSSVVVPVIERLNFRRLNTDFAYEEFLRKRLSTSPAPLSIAYCANVWKRSEFDGIEVNLRGERDLVKKNCDYHESLVVGQKNIGGACHFLVRNTWGTRWNAANRRHPCVCRDKLTGKMSDDCRPETHGHDRYDVEGCWLRGADLARNIGQITFVK